MTNLTPKQQEKLRLLETSLGVKVAEDTSVRESVEPNLIICASLRREEQLQYNFMFIYQTLVLIFAVVVLVLLIFAGWRIATGAPSQAVIAGAGALVGGASAVFLIRQRADARDTYKAAQAGLAKHGCRK